MQIIEKVNSIIAEMQKVVVEDRTMSPPWWHNQAVRLASLWAEIKNEKNKAQILFKIEVTGLIKQGKKISEARYEAEATSQNYKLYLELEALDTVINEFIKLAKKRAAIEQFID